MDETKRITLNALDELALKDGFTIPLLTKDYMLTYILYLIKNVEGIYFKGGTALNKIFLHHARLSEDLDFTLARSEKEVQKEIHSILEKNEFVESMSEGKMVDGFLRMIVHYNLYSRTGEVFIDLNKRATMLLNSEEHEIKHFYEGYLPKFSVPTLAQEEMIAEKLKATMTRNKPRDHYDIYKIIETGLPLNLHLAEQKCKEAGKEFSIVRMFKNAQKLKTQWEPDLVPLLAKEVSFKTIIKTLAMHFKLKEEKEKVRKQKGQHEK